ncbi:hypothetical protein [Roseovarius ramblicola]|uniref:Uncharacterized protein n=1 Tax=Roseovarius ramblicola TaxID=2022336 RepID=A0ABV5I2K2_9RHOB
MGGKSAPDWSALAGVFGGLRQTEDRAKALARDLAEERAAILEYEGGFSRREAEAAASDTWGVMIGCGGLSGDAMPDGKDSNDPNSRSPTPPECT